jgi:hypothetical protein
MQLLGKKLSKANAIYLIIWFIVMVSSVVYFTTNYFKYQHELKAIVLKKINGIVLESWDENRGFYRLAVKDHISKSKLIYEIPQSYFFTTNSIQNGDSVSKEAGVDSMTFYKKDNGVYNKCCSVSISM